MIKTVFHVDSLQNPISALEELFRGSGLSLIQAAFRHSFFLDPERVRINTPRFPDFARQSRTHYPGKKKGDFAQWKGRRVRLDDNTRGQMAWKWYSGRDMERSSGYGVRHIWGNPWNPDAYTAGWNLCYMPFWVGMLTEDQHPHPDLQRAIQQAGYDLFFRKNPVCTAPDFVKDPGLDLGKILGDQPVLILGKANAPQPAAEPLTGSPELKVLDIRSRTNMSWAYLLKAARSLQGDGRVEFGSVNVAAQSKSLVRKMIRETGWELGELQRFIETRIAAWESSKKPR